MTKQRSRPQRWADAVAAGQSALSALDDALTDLRDLHGEYEEWKDGLPENLVDGPTGEKLTELVDSAEDWLEELESAKDAADSALADCEGADLPRGFGRD